MQQEVVTSVHVVGWEIDESGYTHFYGEVDVADINTLQLIDNDNQYAEFVDRMFAKYGDDIAQLFCAGKLIAHTWDNYRTGVVILPNYNIGIGPTRIRANMKFAESVKGLPICKQ